MNSAPLVCSQEQRDDGIHRDRHERRARGLAHREAHAKNKRRHNHEATTNAEEAGEHSNSRRDGKHRYGAAPRLAGKVHRAPHGDGGCQNDECEQIGNEAVVDNGRQSRTKDCADESRGAKGHPSPNVN